MGPTTQGVLRTSSRPDPPTRLSRNVLKPLGSKVSPKDLPPESYSVNRGGNRGKVDFRVNLVRVGAFRLNYGASLRLNHDGNDSECRLIFFLFPFSVLKNFRR